MSGKFRAHDLVEVTLRSPDARPKQILGAIIGPGEEDGVWRVNLLTTGLILPFPEADLKSSKGSTRE
jgi:hypothetical protein